MFKVTRLFSRMICKLFPNSRKWDWLWLSLMFFGIDIFTKYLAIKFLELQKPVKVFDGFNFYLTYNKGAAFSLFANESGWQHWFFLIFAGILSIVILIWMARMSVGNNWGLAGLALILSGAIGNALDRVMNGAVTDFMDFYIQSYHWPTFNIADSAICIGVIFLIINEGRRRY